MTTTLHAAAPIGQIHSPVNWIFSTAAARQAVGTYTTLQLGCEALQTDTSPPTLWKLFAVASPGSAATPTWRQINTTADGGGGGGGPTGTDYGALAVSNGLTVVGYYRADYAASVTGTSGTGKASWAPVSGTMSAITPGGTATNGIGSVTAGLNSRAGLKLDGSTQIGQYTAPTLAAPGTTNWHRYWIARQASAGVSGAAREVLTESGNAYQIQFASATILYAYGAGPSGSPGAQADIWQRGRVSCTGVASTGEFKLGNVLATGVGSAVNTAPNTARQFGDLLLNWEWLMYMEVTGTLANFHTFATAADTAAQTDWGSTVQI